MHIKTSSENIKFEISTKNEYSLTNFKDSYTLDYGKNVIEIKVTDSTGNFDKSRTYKFNVNREDIRKDNNNLKTLTICDNKIDLKDNKENYMIEVPFETENAVINYTLEDSTAKSKLEGNEKLALGKNDYKIHVTSEKGTTKTYNISIIRLNKVLSKNNNINNIEIENYELEFKKEIHDYTVKIKNEKELNIKVDLEDKNATYQIVGNNNLKDGNRIYINVISESGNLLTYSISVEKPIPIIFWLIPTLTVLCITVVAIIFFIKKKKNKEIVKP